MTPTKCICVSHICLTINSDCFRKQPWLVGLCSGDIMDFLWGKNWIIIIGRNSVISKHSGFLTNKYMVTVPDVAQNQKWLCWRGPAANYWFAKSSKGTGSAIVRILENNGIWEIRLYYSKYTYPPTVVNSLNVHRFICFYLICHFTIFWRGAKKSDSLTFIASQQLAIPRQRIHR
jgi:hypothetical protein